MYWKTQEIWEIKSALGLHSRLLGSIKELEKAKGHHWGFLKEQMKL